MLFWKYFCYKNNIVNDYINTDFFAQISSRIYIFENYKLFFNYFFLSNEKFIIALALFSISFYLTFNKNLFFYVIFLFSAYLIIILLVHLSTPLDYVHQLHTTSFRIVKTFSFLLGFFAVYNLRIKNDYN